MSRIAIVTGVDRGGIGSAAAVRLAEDGMAVALFAADQASCADTVRLITARGGRALAIGVDVGDATSVDAALAGVCAGLGDPGVLVNVVGSAAPGPSSGVFERDWYASTDGRLRGLFLVNRAVVDPMARIGWGRIVTIAEGAAPDEHGDATVRAGLAGFTRTVALELRPLGITANLITVAAPGNRPGYRAGVIAALPFLVSDAAEAVSGQVVHVGAAD